MADHPLRHPSFDYGSMRDIWGYSTFTFGSVPCSFEPSGAFAGDGPPEENRNMVEGLTTEIPKHVSVNPVDSVQDGACFGSFMMIVMR